MKTIQKSLLVKSKKREKLRNNIFAERNILSQLHYPFICNIHCILISY